MLLQEVSKDDLQRVFNKTMLAAPFDTTFHKLYEAVNVTWYSCPDDSRNMAHRLFDSLIEAYEQGRMKMKEYEISSGCMRLVFDTHVDGILNCEINFESLTSGYGSLNIR